MYIFSIVCLVQAAYCVMSRNSAQFCFGCKRKHPSLLWYGTDPFHFCGASYTRMVRAGQRVLHPSWPAYEDGAVATDATGARICAATFRKDVLAMREGSVLMSGSLLSPSSRMLVSLLASTYYFQWPSQAFVLRIVALRCKEPSKTRLARIGAEVFEYFSNFRVVDGELVASSRTASRRRGISCTKNPSERRCGSIRFAEIIDNLPSVLDMLGRVQKYFAGKATVSVSAMLSVIGQAGIYGERVSYKNVRLCRILAEAGGKKFKDCSEDFRVFQRMSPHLREALKLYGIADFQVSMKFVKGMKAVTGLDGYCLNDLIIYTCLLGDVVFDA